MTYEKLGRGTRIAVPKGRSSLSVFVSLAGRPIQDPPPMVDIADIA
jgi:hypothetical protein